MRQLLVCVFFIVVDAVAIKEGTVAENVQGKVASTSYSSSITSPLLNGANILSYTDTLATGAGHGGVLTGAVGHGGVFPMQIAALPASYPLAFLRPQQVPLTYALALNQPSAVASAASTAPLATVKQDPTMGKNQPQTSSSTNVLTNQLNTGLQLNSNLGKDNNANIQTGLSKGVPIGQVIGFTSVPKQGYNLGLLGSGTGLGLGSTALGSNLNIGLIPNLNIGFGSAGFGSPVNLGLGTPDLGSNLNLLAGTVKTSTDSGSPGANTNTAASSNTGVAVGNESSFLKGQSSTLNSGLKQGLGFISTTGFGLGSNLGKGLVNNKFGQELSSSKDQTKFSSPFNSGIKSVGTFNALQTGKHIDDSFSPHFSSASSVSPFKHKTVGLHSTSGHTLNPDVQSKQTGLSGFNFKQGVSSYLPSGSGNVKLEHLKQNNKEIGTFKHGHNSNVATGSMNFKFGHDSPFATGSSNNFKHGHDLLTSPQKQGYDDLGFGSSSFPSFSSISNTPQPRHNFNYGSGGNSFSSGPKYNLSQKQPTNIITGSNKLHIPTNNFGSDTSRFPHTNIGTVKHSDDENHSLGSTGIEHGSPFKPGINALKSESSLNINTGHEHGGFGHASSFASNFLLGHSSSSKTDLSNEHKFEAQKPNNFENPGFNHISNFNMVSANSALGQSLNTKLGSHSSASSHKGIVLPGIPSSGHPSHESLSTPSQGDNSDSKHTGRGSVKFNHNIGTHHIHSTRVNTKVNNIRGPVSFNQEISDMYGHDHGSSKNNGHMFGATNINKHVEPSTQPIMLQPAFAGNSHTHSSSVAPNSGGHNRGTGPHSGIEDQGPRKGFSEHGTGSNFGSGGLHKHIGPQKEGMNKFPHVQSAGIGLGSLTSANLPKNVAISTSNFISGNGGPMGHVTVSLHGEPGRSSR